MRLGAALLVVFVHSGNLILAYQAETPMFLKPFLMLADAGDAIFMMISGYLLFLHPFQYGSMLKKKVRTILVPLVLWNLIWILIDLVRLDLRGTASGILTWPVSTCMINLFGIPFHTAPFYMPFWFLTDLFGLILLSPLIRFFTKKTPFLAAAGIVILWFLPISYRIRIPFCFFLFGALLAEYPQWKEKLKRIAEKISLPSALLCSLLVLVLPSSWYDLLDRITLILWIWPIGKLAETCMKNQKTASRIELAASWNMFLYAVHGKVISYLQGVYTAQFAGSDGSIIAGYFGLALLSILFCWTAAAIVQHLLPRLYGVLSGGRGVPIHL